MLVMLSKLTNNYAKYGKELNSFDLYKFIAILFMTIDHLGMIFFTDNDTYRAFGRICIPIWFFLVGYGKVSLPNKELIICCAFVFLIQLIFKDGFFLPVNVLLTIIIAKFVLYQIDKSDDFNIYLLFILLTIFYLPSELIAEYGTMAMMFAVCGYLRRKNIKQNLYPYFLGLTIIYFLIMQQVFFEFDILNIIIMTLGVLLISYKLKNFEHRKYNITNSRLIRFLGRNTLYYYTAHLTIFYIVASII